MSRTAYHHGNLREALVAEAVSAVRADGAEALSLRELARRVGVSHNAAYRHFAHRDDLVAVVAERTMTALGEAMERELGGVDEADPVLRARLRLAGVGRAYVEYALAERGLVQVAFGSRAGENADQVLKETPYVLLGQALDDLVAVGFLSTEARVGAEELCWSTVHGFASLVLAGHVQVADLADHLDRLLGAVDRSLGASTDRADQAAT